MADLLPSIKLPHKRNPSHTQVPLLTPGQHLQAPFVPGPCPSFRLRLCSRPRPAVHTHLLHTRTQRLLLHKERGIAGPGEGELTEDVRAQEVALRELEHQANLCVQVQWGTIQERTHVQVQWGTIQERAHVQVQWGTIQERAHVQVQWGTIQERAHVQVQWGTIQERTHVQVQWGTIQERTQGQALPRCPAGCARRGPMHGKA